MNTVPRPSRIRHNGDTCANVQQGPVPRILSAFWERGSLDLPACGLRRGSSGGPTRPIFINTRLKTLARRTTWSFLQHGLLRLAREEAERSRWGTSRGAHD